MTNTTLASLKILQSGIQHYHLQLLRIFIMGPIRRLALKTTIHLQVYMLIGNIMRVQEILYLITQGIIIMELLTVTPNGMQHLPLLHLAL